MSLFLARTPPRSLRGIRHRRRRSGSQAREQRPIDPAGESGPCFTGESAKYILCSRAQSVQSPASYPLASGISRSREMCPFPPARVLNSFQERARSLALLHKIFRRARAAPISRTRRKTQLGTVETAERLSRFTARLVHPSRKIVPANCQTGKKRKKLFPRRYESNFRASLPPLFLLPGRLSAVFHANYVRLGPPP